MSMPHALIVDPLLEGFLREDLGRAGDITTDAIAPDGLTARCSFTFRQAGVVCGLELARRVFALVDPAVQVTLHAKDGDTIPAGTVVAEVSGPARGILTGERVALNLMGRLSGIATLTRHCVDQAAPHGTRIACTRKTTPGLRLVEKQAVLHGGGFNQRFSLSDAILIKDNHIAAAGGIRPVLEAVKARASHMMRVEIEVDRLEQLAEVLDEGGADVVLLDNMDTPTLRQAVAMAGGRVVLEASGNMRLDRIAEVAATGVDYISSGALTHSARTLDLGLDF